MTLLRRTPPLTSLAGRLWLAGTLVWFAMIAMIEAGPIALYTARHETARAITEGAAPVTILPLLCEDAKGVRYLDHQVRPAVPGGPLYCWFEVATVRRLYPEYASLGDQALYFATWLKTGQPVTLAASRERLNSKLIATAVEAATPPLVALAAMLLFGWWLQGGRRQRRQRPPTRTLQPN